MTRFHPNIFPVSRLGLGIFLVLTLGLFSEKGLARPISVEDVPPLPVSEGSSADLEGVVSPNPQWWLLGRGGQFSEAVEIESGYEISSDYYVITTEKLNLTLDNMGIQQGDPSRLTRRFPFALF